LKVGAGGLQSQIVEDAIKTRQVDPARNKPGQDDHTSFDPLDGGKRARQELHPPLTQSSRGAAVDNFTPHREMAAENQAFQPNAGNLAANKTFGTIIDVYV
jgi:hypothetical protein